MWGHPTPWTLKVCLPVGSGVASLHLRTPTHYIINTFVVHISNANIHKFLNPLKRLYLSA